MAPAACALRMLGHRVPTFLIPRDDNEVQIAKRHFPEATLANTTQMEPKLNEMLGSCMRDGTSPLLVVEFTAATTLDIDALVMLVLSYDNFTSGKCALLIVTGDGSPLPSPAWTQQLDLVPFRLKELDLAPFDPGKIYWLRGLPQWPKRFKSAELR